MNPLLTVLAFDKTGASVNNLRSNEFHDLSALVSQPNRCFVLDHGAFYRDSLVLLDSSGRELSEELDYQLTGNSQTAQVKTGLAVCTVIILTNPKVGSTVYATAQMVGGPEGSLKEATARFANMVMNTGRSAYWKNVEDKPDAYLGSGHFHPMWQLYGFEGFNASSQRVSEALKARSRKRYGVVQTAFDVSMDAVVAQGEVEKAKLAAHVARVDNPHKLTAAQVVLEKVMNYGIATTAEAQAKGSSLKTKYMTPLSGKQSIQVNFLDNLTVHKQDFNNPHGVTPTQAGSLSTGDTDSLLNQKLGINETAADSARFAGANYTQIYNALRANLDAAMVQAVGRFPPSMIGSPVYVPGGAGGLSRAWVLAGSGQWRQIQEIFNNYAKKASSLQVLGGVYASADAGRNQAAATFADNTAYPNGTIVLFTCTWAQGPYSTGNGSRVTTSIALLATVKTASGWVY